MILILGGGFGLYGHLAALATMGQKVVTLERYRPAIEARPELRHLLEKLSWCRDEDASLSLVDTVALVRRPHDNATMAERLARQGWAGRLVVEKPLAEDSARASSLLETIGHSTCQLSVPYLFLHCDWSEQLATAHAAPGGAQAKIDWHIVQPPQTHSWKSSRHEGGGALAFYFIHCLALIEGMMPLARLTFESTGNGAKTTELRLGAKRNDSTLNITFALGSEQARFDVDLAGKPLMRGASPFGLAPKAGIPDPRIVPLQRFYRDTVFGPHPQPLVFHERIVELWRKYEKHESNPSE